VRNLEAVFMNQRLLCSLFVVSLSYACGSSNNGNGNGGGAGANGRAGSGNSNAGAAGGTVVGTSGSAGMPSGLAGGTSAGASSTGTAGAGPGGAGTAGTMATAGASGAGAAGSGTAGAAGAAGAPMGTVGDNQNVTQRGGDNARTAHWVQSTFTTASVAKMALDANFKGNFSGQMSAVPLFVAGATPGTGFYIVATQGNKIYALNEATGAIKWTGDLGPPQNGHMGGEVSTPVIDATTRTVYLAAAMATNRYELHALNVDTGMELANWPVVLSSINSGNVAMEFGATEQRSALSLVSGVVYTAFGGYAGDGGNYRGWVIAVNATDPTKTGAWAVMDNRQAGIWAAGGMASDGNGVFAVTGNSGGTNHATSDSEEVIRITGLGTPNRDDANMFYPDIWSNNMNSRDLDFGSCSPMVLTVPNSTPSKIIVAPAKPGIVYVLDAAKLGGNNGSLSSRAVAARDMESVYTAPTGYQVGTGVNVAISTGVGSQCGGNTTGGAVMGLTVQPGNGTVQPALLYKWCANISSNRHSPVSTNSNGAGADPIVWFLNGASLNAYNGDTGAVVYPPAGVTAAVCDGVQQFTALIVADGHVVAGGNGHLCSFSVH
jgi:PQQ enzyme repeat